MRARLLPLILGAGVLSCTSAPNPNTGALRLQALPREYAGVYISTQDEDYFAPCGIAGAGEGWSLRFRDHEPQAPFLNKVTAIRGYAPLTHFIRVRGRLGPPGSYNIGFQTRELAVDSVLDVRETLEPCRGFGVPAAWTGFRQRIRGSRAFALSNDRRLVAMMDEQRQISIWSTAIGELVSRLSSSDKGDQDFSSGPIAFSADAQLLAVGGSDGIVRVWRIRERKKVFSLALKDSATVAAEMARIPPRPELGGWRPPPPPNSYTSARDLVFNKRGTMLATSNLFSSIVWSMKTGEKIAEFPLGNDFRRRIFFLGDDGLIMTADSGRMIIRSNLNAPPVTRPGTRAPWTEHVTMSPDGRTLAVSSWADSVYLWSTREGPGRVLHVPAFVTGVMAFSPDGRMIAVAGGMFGLYVYNTRTGAPVTSFHNFPGALTGAWFSADGKSIITLSSFDDRFRVVYIDPRARPSAEPIFDDSLTATLPLGPPPSTSPRTIGGTVTGPKQRAVAGASVEISDGEAPDSVIARTTTSAGGYFSFNGIRFRHVLIRVRAPGFATGVKYIHVNRWADEGPWGIELTPREEGSGRREEGRERR
ncbi:MAG TPA: carboxypeptidase regulatory-like domain-containing protein [Gemmatimonadaceae bacterium]|nr:carboxypeptidase regulatory-like domain-containing protein [Gemmatimonadaceae bacterium]